MYVQQMTCEQRNFDLGGQRSTSSFGAHRNGFGLVVCGGDIGGGGGGGGGTAALFVIAAFNLILFIC